MEFLGVGPMELFFILALALILMGPNDMKKTGKILGKWMNDFLKSDWWQAMRGTSKMISALPTQLMREANLEEMQKDLTINPIQSKYNYEDMDAVAKAPEQFRAPHLAEPEAGELEKTIVAPARSQPFNPAQPPPVPEPTSTEATLLEMDPKAVKPGKVGKSAEGKSSNSSMPAKAPAGERGAAAGKSKRGKKANA